MSKHGRTVARLLCVAASFIIVALTAFGGNLAEVQDVRADQAAQPMPLGQTDVGQLAFADQFDAPALDTNRWQTCFWWASTTCSIESNNELELYDANDVLLQDGMLRLRAERRAMQGWNNRMYAYTSGMVMTGGRQGQRSPGFTFTYGFVEVQARLPRGKGLWPAIWLLPASYTWPPELDVLEVLGDQPAVANMHVHWLTASHDEAQVGTEWAGPDLSQDWHTFGFSWRPDALVWYIDGVERWRVNDTTIIPNEPMYIVLNLAVGGDWPGAPDSSTPFPSYFDVHYVRVWS